MVFICDFIILEKIFILALIEIWLFGDEYDNLIIAIIINCFFYFNIIYRVRVGRGGGVCIMYYKGLIVKLLIF